MTSHSRSGEPGGCCGGKDDCCGGAAATVREPTPEKGIGTVVATCELALDGLRCMNCVAHAKKALEAIPGIAADVTLDPPRALVRMDPYCSWGIGPTSPPLAPFPLETAIITFIKGFVK